MASIDSTHERAVWKDSAVAIMNRMYHNRTSLVDHGVLWKVHRLKVRHVGNTSCDKVTVTTGSVSSWAAVEDGTFHLKFQLGLQVLLKEMAGLQAGCLAIFTCWKPEAFPDLTATAAASL